MTIAPSARTRQVGDAAIAVLAEHGARGLTHRAVDQAAGLPPGTTSNYARTRAALLTLALARIAELDAAEGAARRAPSELSEPGYSGSGLSGSGVSGSGMSGPGYLVPECPVGWVIRCWIVPVLGWPTGWR